MSGFRVYPLLYATMQSMAFGRVMGVGHGGDYGATYKAAILGYAVDDGEHKILVDTGPPDQATMEKIDGRPYGDYASVTDALQKTVGWKPDDVNIVVNTHLHFDHCSGNVLFPKAEHYIQRTEVRYAAAPTGSNKPWPIVRNPKFWDLELRLVSGDYPLGENVTLITLPGHSPGHQGVLLEGKRRAILTGDQIHSFVNWEHRKPGFFTHDAENWYASTAKMERLQPDLVFPGHDFDVFKKKVYEV